MTRFFSGYFRVGRESVIIFHYLLICLAAGRFVYTNGVTIFDLVSSSSFGEYYKAETFPLTRKWMSLLHCEGTGCPKLGMYHIWILNKILCFWSIIWFSAACYTELFAILAGTLQVTLCYGSSEKASKPKSSNFVWKRNRLFWHNENYRNALQLAMLRHVEQFCKLPKN